MIHHNLKIERKYYPSLDSAHAVLSLDSVATLKIV